MTAQRMRQLAAVVVAGGALVSLAAGGPMDARRVAGDARWVAHLDVAGLLKSGLAKFVLAEAEKKDSFLEGIAKVRQTLGFDPLSDIRGVTIYGKRIGQDSATVILDATVDQQKLLQLISANPSYKVSQYGDRALHQWTDEPKSRVDPKTGEEVFRPAKTNYGTFYDANTILVASSMDLLKEAVDVLDGRAANLAGTGAIKLLPAEPDEGTFLLAAAEDLRLPPGHKDANNPLVKNITNAAVQVGESEGNMFLSAVATAPDARRALRLRQIIQGFVALGQMMLAEREDLPVLGEEVRVDGTGSEVTVEASVPTASLIEMIKFLAARKKARAAGGGGAKDAF